MEEFICDCCGTTVEGASRITMKDYVVEYEIYPFRAIYTEEVSAIDSDNAEGIVLSDMAKQTLDVRIRRVYQK